MFFVSPAGVLVNRGFSPNQDTAALIFDNGSATSFSRTFSSDGGDTWSFFMVFYRHKLGVRQALFGHAGDDASISLGSGNTIELNDDGAANIETEALLVDTVGPVYLLVTGNGTANKVYQGFNELTLDAACNIGSLNAATEHYIGDAAFAVENPSITASVVGFVDGTELTPSDVFDTDSRGVTIFKGYGGSYGGNGVLLEFSDNSTASALGTDTSGQGNDWTVNNFATTDQVRDTWSNNYGTYNPLVPAAPTNTFSYGNRSVTTSVANRPTIPLTIPLPSSGDWYTEFTINSSGGMCGVRLLSAEDDIDAYNSSDTWGYYNHEKVNGGSATALTGTPDAFPRRIGLHFDSDAGTLDFYAPISSVMTNVGGFTGLTDSDGYVFFVGDGSGGLSVDIDLHPEQGQWDIVSPPGQELCTANLPKPVITDGANHFKTVTYTGTGASNAITGVGFQPDVVNIKRLDTTGDWNMYDVLRGATKNIKNNATSAESTEVNGLTSFDADGFTVGTEADVNASGGSFVAYCYKLGGSGVSNTDGSITSTVSANTVAGQSVLTFTGTGSNGTVGHGLEEPPEFILVKNTADVSSWRVGHEGIASDPWTDYLVLNSTTASSDDATVWQDTPPTGSVISVGTEGPVNGSGDTIVMYCFHSVEGYSKFGSYSGNGSSDGPFVYCSFKPRYILVKRTNSADDWVVLDTERDTFNQVGSYILANTSSAEQTFSTVKVNVTANGFKVAGSANNLNASGGNYIFAAFAEHPFGGKGIAPATAF